MTSLRCTQRDHPHGSLLALDHACSNAYGAEPAGDIAWLHVQGEVLDTLRHGSGKQTCSNGDTYDGAWQYDKRHGRGTANLARGVCYQGQWKEDMAHGCVTADLLGLFSHLQCIVSHHFTFHLCY